MLAAELIAIQESTCLRRKVGAVITNTDGKIISLGANGVPVGTEPCDPCIREKLGIESGTHHEICKAVHAEQNAILNAKCDLSGTIIYCTHHPCVICAKMIINAGISKIVYKEGYPDELSKQFLYEAGIQVEEYYEN